MVLMKSSMNSSVFTFSIKKRVYDLSMEVAHVSSATTFLLRGTERMVAMLLGTTSIKMGVGVEGVTTELPTMMLARAAIP